MTGFKEGAASSGLGSDDDENDEGDEPSNQLQEETQNEPQQSRETELITSDEPTNSSSSETSAIPWIYRRSGITDGREKTVQLHLQQSTLEDEVTQLSEIEDLVGESVKKADLREAAYLVGLNHLDEVADHLREWGYDAR
jgi:hypothetical protein